MTADFPSARTLGPAKGEVLRLGPKSYHLRLANHHWPHGWSNANIDHIHLVLVAAVGALFGAIAVYSRQPSVIGVFGFMCMLLSLIPIALRLGGSLAARRPAPTVRVDDEGVTRGESRIVWKDVSAALVTNYGIVLEKSGLSLVLVPDHVSHEEWQILAARVAAFPEHYRYSLHIRSFGPLTVRSWGFALWGSIFAFGGCLTLPILWNAAW